ncbi:MAG: hypothetical protein HRT35_08725 [Algicola sp.]|nr:hypothetical protein [Algicola sp.]
MHYVIVLALILMMIAVMWFVQGSSSDGEKVRGRATKMLGDVMEANEYCAKHNLTMAQLQQKIDASEIRAYSSGDFLFVQVEG